MSTTGLPESNNTLATFQTEPWQGDFSYGYYFGLVNQIQESCDIQTFSEVAALPDDMPRPTALIRHDIDTGVAKALQLARQEAQEGIRATYFAIPNIEDYDIKDKNTAAMLARIAGYGHEVGLHYNPDEFFRDTVTDPYELVEDMVRHATDLSQALDGRPVISTSFHNPSAKNTAWLGGGRRLGDLVNAYAGEYMLPSHGALYATDSNGIWRYGEPGARINKALLAGARVIQLLTHAERWG